MPAQARASETAQVVKITASKFHFTPDRIVLAKGQPVTLQLTSADRVHGFMVRAFGIDTDIQPGKTTAHHDHTRRRPELTPRSATTTADSATAG